jgi:oligopeptide transport system ATP-binding protein
VLGRLAEVADAETLYREPKHPYTRMLLSAVPIADPAKARQRRRTAVSGEVPSPEREYPGCAFADRCPIAEESCRRGPPQLEGEEHPVACFKAHSSPR